MGAARMLLRDLVARNMNLSAGFQDAFASLSVPSRATEENCHYLGRETARLHFDARSGSGGHQLVVFLP